MEFGSKVAAGPSRPSDQDPPLPSPPFDDSCRRNVFSLLARREISPRLKNFPKRLWGEACKRKAELRSKSLSEMAQDPKRALFSWVEAESLRHLTAEYCPLMPPPRSTIAAAFSPDGRTLASTHGDHTVKIIDCQTGKCLRVLNGHRRTPWVVRFHPSCPEVLASGSLDYEVRLWNANTSRCIGCCDFYRPIASIAFHAKGELLAVAAGHKLYIWNYINKTAPSIVLKTRRSLRAVHFHPHAIPLLLTAEVNDVEPSEYLMTPATTLGYLQYPPPSVFVANIHSDDSMTYFGDLVFSPFVPSPAWDLNRPISRIEQDMVQNVASTHAQPNANIAQHHSSLSSNPVQSDAMETDDMQLNYFNSSRYQESVRDQNNRTTEYGQHHQGSLVGQNQFGLPERPVLNGGNSELLAEFPRSRFFSSRPESNNVSRSESGDPQAIISRVQSELAASMSDGTELPCTVKLRVWSHDTENPSALLTPERCRLVIPQAVLCSEMGAHFSPCGRFLAACVACSIGQMEAEPGFQNLVHQDHGAATSPTQHPISEHQVIYELRIYSLEKTSFGSVLMSRAIRAAHCLTSIQFSPTSEHILLAYGRRHISLLKNVIADGRTTLPIFTVLEIYRVADMELMRVFPSAADEVNVACFHPSPGGGLVYGTKEGKLKILRYETGFGQHSSNLY